MGTAVSMPDTDSQKFLSDARSQAVADLKGKAPDPLTAVPPPAQPRAANAPGQNIANAAPPLPPPEPPPSATPVQETPTAPPPTATPITNDIGIGSDLKRNAKEVDSALGNAVQRAGAIVAQTLGFAAAGANTLIQGDEKAASGNDAIFDFLRNHISTWYDRYKQDPNASGAAKFIGNAAEGLAPLALGPTAGAATIAANATIEAGKTSVDAGDNTMTAATLAFIHGAAATAQLSVGFKDPSIVKRIAKWVGVGEVIDKATDALTRYIINNEAYRKTVERYKQERGETAADLLPKPPWTGTEYADAERGDQDQVPDMLTPSKDAINAIQQTIFAILHTPRGAELVKKADPNGPPPPATATPVTPDLSAEDNNTPPPPPDAAPVTPAPATETAPVASTPATPAVPDKPTAEPAADLLAQIEHMNTPGSSRKAVYLSKANVDNLGPEGVKALAGTNIITKNFDRTGGVLISPNHSERSKATALRKANGDDMQKTLGALTGAGDGKSLDQTAVVQGQTPEGAVATEKTVTPADVPAAVAAAQAEGKTPVVTTPPNAIARRADQIAQENSVAPSPAATPVGENVAASPEVGTNLPKEGTPVPSKDSTLTETSPVNDGTPKAGDRRIVTVAGKEMPVVIAGDPVGNKVPVRLIDEEGRISKQVQNVPLEMFKKASDTESPTPADAELRASEPSEAKQPEGSAPATAEPGSPLEQAAALYDKENTPEPGKKYAGSVAEHAARVAGLARALDTHLKTAEGLPDDVRAHAQEAANRAKNLDNKTPEQLAKNQGVSHLSADARAKDIKQAIRNIVNPAEAKIPVRVEVKANTLKRLQAKKVEVAERLARTPPEQLEAASKAVKRTMAEGEKVSSGIKDVEDETKEKVLNAGEKAKIANAAKRYLGAGIDDAPGAHDNLERVLHDIYGEKRTGEAEQWLNIVRDQREAQEEARRPRRMSDTVDDEDFKGQHVDGAEGDEEEGQELRMSDADFKNTPMGKLHDTLQNTGFWKQFGEARDNGKFLSTHKILSHLINVSDSNPAMRAILSKLRAHTPDLPIRPVDQVIHPGSGIARPAATAGLFHAGSSSIQVRVPSAVADLDRVPHTTTHALVHEIVHAATSYEMHNNPTGHFAREIDGLLEEARRQANGAQHYGLTDRHEFVAEALTSPDFQKFLAGSKSADNQPRSLFTRVADAITRLLGIKDPRARNLLQDTMASVERGINEQARNLPDSMRTARAPDFLRNMGDDVRNRLAAQGREQAPDHMPGLDAILDDSRAAAIHEDIAHGLEEEPKPLQHDDEIRSVIGDAATGTARLFRRAIRSGTVEKIRETTRALTPYGGLVRAALRRGVFGYIDDPTNPLRNYDEQIQQRNAIINKLTHSAEPIVNDRAKLSTLDNRKLGQFQIDSTMHGIDPEVSKADTPKSISAAKGFYGRYDDLQRRWGNLTDQQKDIYRRERDWNEKAMRQLRKASVDVALDSYSDKDVSPAQRQLLYSVSDKGDFSKLIGKNKMIDVGDRNDKLVESLSDLSSTNELEGPYFHLGRHGDYVVQATPEGTKTFPDQSAAEMFANRVRDLSPNSKAKVALVGGKWQVDYKAEHVSMHNSPAEAEAAIEKLRAAGIDVGSATQKILSKDNASLSNGMENIVAGAASRLKRRGEDDTTKATIEALRQSFVAQMAARSAYAGSKLARRNIGGVKPEEMGRNFANHAQSLSWNTGHISKVFKVGEALGQLREATKDANQPQGRALQRGRVYDEITKRTRQEVTDAGSSQPMNSVIAKVGFANYMTSLSHSIMYTTQNLTTTGFVLAARFGLKGPRSLTSAMAMMSGPSFREAYRAAVPWEKGHNADTIQRAIMQAVAQDKRFGRWAKGDNSPLQQLIDRGAIHTSLSNQIATKAKGGNEYVNRVMQYARIAPTMADMFNRVTTGLAGLEMHNGDVYKAGDLIRETHMDYSNEDKPRALRALNKVWGGNSITMFKTYTIGMTHLLYSHFHDLAMGDSEGGRGEALKVIAGMMLGASLFAGVQRGAGIEPLRIAMYAYNRIAHPDKYYSFDNMTRRAVHAFAGDGKTANVIDYGLPSLIGTDMSSRMGLSDLMLHDPPDITALDNVDGWRKLAFASLGAGAEELSNKYVAAQNAMMSGRMDDWAKVVPFKFLNNLYDSWSTGTKGKVTASGAQITAPSAGAAVSHAIGFRTAEEAKIAGKEQTDAEYKDFANTRKQMMIGAYQRMGSPAEKQQFYLDTIKPWNNENLGQQVTYSDLLKRHKSVNRTERTAEGFLGRDPVQNELNDY